MSIFKTSNIFNRKFNALGISGAEASKEAYDYIIDSVQETNTTSAFVKNTVESVEFAQESTVSSTAPRRIVYGTAVVGGNIVWRISEETGEAQFAIVWAEGCNAVNTIFLDGIDVAPSGSYPTGYFGGNFVAESFTGLTGFQNLTDSFLISKKPSYWDGLHYFSGCAYSYIFLRFNSTAFPNGFPSVTAEIEGRRIYDPRKDSTSGSILYNPSLGVSSHRLATSSTWQYDDNAALCLLDYMLDSRLGLGESFDSFDQQSLRDAIDICEQGVTSATAVTKRYTCNGSIFADKSHRENIKQILSTMNGKLIYSNGKYYIKPYAYETPHSQIVDESMIVGTINYSAKQGRADSYNRVKGKFNSLHDGYVVTDYPVQYSGVDADGLTYDDKDGETLYLEHNLPLTTNVEDAQRLARLMMLRSRMQATVTFTANMKALAYKVGDTIQFSNAILGFTSGFEKEFEITDYVIANDTDTGITVQITAKEVVLAIYNWQASDLIDYTANDLVETWDGLVAAPTNLTVTETIFVDDANNPQAAMVIEFDYASTNQLAFFEVRLYDPIAQEVVFTKETVNKNIVLTKTEAGLGSGLAFIVQVASVSTAGKKSEYIASTTATILDQPKQGNSIYYYESNNLNAPTESEFLNRFGFNIADGDVIIVFTTQNGIIDDSKEYVYKPEIQSHYVSSEFRPIGDLSDPQNPKKAEIGIYFYLDYDSFQNIPVTWTYNFTYFVNSHYQNVITSPTNFSTSTDRGGTRFKIYSSPNTSIYPNEYHYEQYSISITATWATGSATYNVRGRITLINEY